MRIRDPKHRPRAWVYVLIPLLSGVMVGMMNVAPLQQPAAAVEPPPIPVAPLLAIQELVSEPREDPLEGDKIEGALITQGYLDPEVPLDYDLQDNPHTACEEYGVDYALVLGLIEVESGFQADAVGPTGCYGLMQLNPRYSPAGLTPAENITAGVEYLGRLLEEHGDVGAALTAYNAGQPYPSSTSAMSLIKASILLPLFSRTAATRPRPMTRVGAAILAAP